VPAPAHGVARGTQRPEHETDQQDDHPYRPENLEGQYETDDEENQSKDDHCLFPLFSERSAGPIGTSSALQTLGTHFLSHLGAALEIHVSEKIASIRMS
jgi:hypothetical protein